MAVVLRKRGNSRVYWIAFSIDERAADGRRMQVWERVGTDKRAAEALDRQRKREVDDGTYTRGRRPTMPFGEWLKDWACKRVNRNASDDRRLIERFLLTRAWLCEIPCEELRPRHAQQLVEELKSTVSEETGRQISEKYVSNVYGLFRTAAQDARIAELIPVDPCVLKRGSLRRSSRLGARVPYDEGETLALINNFSYWGMFAHLALFTGMREGEICGRRWRDWDTQSMPLGCLNVVSQYDDRPLKTARGAGEHARRVPVHPGLDRHLRRWWQEGFEYVYCRKPGLDDFIVPRTTDGKPHTRSSAYKLWILACKLAGVHNRSLHSTRHTFITLARRGGARAEVVERITHNSAGSIVDHYTHWDWAPLCEAVMCLDQTLDTKLDRASEAGVLQVYEGGGAGNRNRRNVRVCSRQ